MQSPHVETVPTTTEDMGTGGHGLNGGWDRGTVGVAGRLWGGEGTGRGLLAKGTEGGGR